MTAPLSALTEWHTKVAEVRERDACRKAAEAEAAEALGSLRTLLHSTQDELAKALVEVEEDVGALRCWRRRTSQAEAERDALRAEVQRLADALAATVQRRGELEAALDYCQQQRRSLQESANQQVEGLRQEVATLKARCEELAAQACCSMREAAALLKKLRGAA